MQVLQDLTERPAHPVVKAILAHLFFVYIHPYPDGNGRTARFLMNEVLSTQGYEWVIVPENKKRDYFQSLEAACSGDDILPFADFLLSLMKVQLKTTLADSRDKPRI